MAASNRRKVTKTPGTTATEGERDNAQQLMSPNHPAAPFLLLQQTLGNQVVQQISSMSPTSGSRPMDSDHPSSPHLAQTKTPVSQRDSSPPDADPMEASAEGMSGPRASQHPSVSAGAGNQQLDVRCDELGLDIEEEEVEGGEREERGPSSSFHETMASIPRSNIPTPAQTTSPPSSADSTSAPNSSASRAPQLPAPGGTGTDTSYQSTFSSQPSAAVNDYEASSPPPAPEVSGKDIPSQMTAASSPSTTASDDASAPTSAPYGPDAGVPPPTTISSQPPTAVTDDGASSPTPAPEVSDTDVSLPTNASLQPSPAVTDDGTPSLTAASDMSNTADSATDATPPRRLVVSDREGKVEQGQMRQSDFLAELRAAVFTTVETELAGTQWTARDCPWISHWFGYYSNQAALHVERAIRRYAPGTSKASVARDYIPIVLDRVRRAVSTWVTTGVVTEVPDGVSAGLPARSGGGLSRSDSDEIYFKGCEGGARNDGDPKEIQAQLGSGRALDSQVKSRMESAYGTSLSNVRVHTDAGAAGLSTRLNARAFTVGEHVAFGSGEYQPGTLVGDALIAHELAHVVQQRDADPGSTKKEQGENSATEADADGSAIRGVSSIWFGGKRALESIGRNAMPRLRSGLGLRRCASTFPSYSQIVADSDVQAATDAAWANTEAAATAAARREEGFWIRLNTGTGDYEFTPTVTGDPVGPAVGATIESLGSRPADTPNPAGTIYTVASFHTHTPTAFRTVARAVGPSAADGAADRADDVTGVVYDYVESPAGSGNIPAGHPIGSAAQRYRSGPNRRQRE